MLALDLYNTELRQKQSNENCWIHPFYDYIFQLYYTLIYTTAGTKNKIIYCFKSAVSTRAYSDCQYCSIHLVGRESFNYQKIIFFIMFYISLIHLMKSLQYNMKFCKKYGVNNFFHSKITVYKYISSGNWKPSVHTIQYILTINRKDANIFY